MSNTQQDHDNLPEQVRKQRDVANEIVEVLYWLEKAGARPTFEQLASELSTDGREQQLRNLLGTWLLRAVVMLEKLRAEIRSYEKILNPTGKQNRQLEFLRTKYATVWGIFDRDPGTMEIMDDAGAMYRESVRLHAELGELRSRIEGLRQDNDRLHLEHDRLVQANERIRELEEREILMASKLQSSRAMAKQADPPPDRVARTDLNIIGGLLNLMLGSTPAGKKQSVFKRQASIIHALIAHHPDLPGISKRTLETKFAQAKKSLNG